MDKYCSYETWIQPSWSVSYRLNTSVSLCGKEVEAKSYIKKPSKFYDFTSLAHTLSIFSWIIYTSRDKEVTHSGLGLGLLIIGD